MTGSPEMEKRIQAILSTGEEEVSVSEADARLGNWQRKRRYSQTGLLPKTEERLKKLSQTMETADKTAREIDTDEALLADSESRCAQIEDALIRERRMYRKKIMQEIKAAREKARELSDEQNQALEELHNKREDLQKSIFRRREMEEVEQEADETAVWLDDECLYRGALCPEDPDGALPGLG